MNKGLIALALISVLAMVIIGGCAKSSPPLTTGNQNSEATGQPGTGGQAVGNTTITTITGQIQDVDKLNSELNDSGLQDIDSQLNEVSW